MKRETLTYTLTIKTDSNWVKTGESLREAISDLYSGMDPGDVTVAPADARTAMWFA